MASKSYGIREHFSGYVTTMASIAGKSAGEVEECLGFAATALASGFYVYVLMDPIGVADFEWKDRTLYSDGWEKSPGILIG